MRFTRLLPLAGLLAQPSSVLGPDQLEVAEPVSMPSVTAPAEAALDPELQVGLQRFGQDGIAVLNREGIQLRAALDAPERFKADDIYPLVHGRIPFEEAARYPERFNGWDIARISGKSGAFGCLDKPLTPKGSEILLAYPKRFDVGEACQFLRQNISGREVRSFASRFDFDEISYYAQRSGVQASVANAYPARYEMQDIVGLLSDGVYPEDVKEGYDRRFSGYDQGSLINSCVTPDEANAAPRRFSGYDLAGLQRNSIPVTAAATYSRRWKGYQIAEFVRGNVDPSTADSYPKWFEAYDVSKCHAMGVTGEDVRTASQREHGTGSSACYDFKYPPSDTGAEEDLLLITPVQEPEPPLSKELYRPYKSRFEVWEAKLLVDANVSAKVALSYPREVNAQWLSARDIITLQGEDGVQPDDTEGLAAFVKARRLPPVCER